MPTASTPLAVAPAWTRPLASTRSLAGVVGFAALVSLGARVGVPLPFTPVPLTLQVLFVLLAGALLGPRLGAASMALYLAVGALGAPVFAAGGGPAYLLGPTGGYLVGYVPAAALVGWASGRSSSYWRIALSMTAGLAAIYICGALHLSAFLGRGAVEAGIAPFLAADLLKVAAGATLAAAWRRRPRS